MLAVSHAHAAGTTSPGKNSVHASADAQPMAGSPVLTAQILKGKKKTVLEIDATAPLNVALQGAVALGAPLCDVSLRVRVVKK